MRSYIDVDVRLGKMLGEKNYPVRAMDKAVEAATFIVEEGYVDETPVDEGDFRLGIETQKRKELHYVVASTATSDFGEEYPYYLYTGTGALFGSPDYGYTTGRVRLNDIASGIGGIRPNKAAKRAKESTEDDVVRFIKKNIYSKLDD